MIQFACTGCGREFSVPDHFAGKKANCNQCQTALVVPTVSKAPSPLPSAIAVSPRRLSVRTRRQMADFQQMVEVLNGHPMIRIKETAGDPPELYRIEYLVRSVEKLQNDEPIFRESHVAEVQMTQEYPRIAPHCRMLTPIFHPNIDAASICVGDHWVAGERLTDLVIRIGEMIAYQAYNIKSPLNGEAAMWADLHPEKLPIDIRGLDVEKAARGSAT